MWRRPAASSPPRCSATLSSSPRRISASSRHRGRRGRSRPEAFPLQIAVEAGDELAIAVEDLRRHPLPGAEHPLARLAPARMRDLRVHIGPEAVFRGLDRFPEALRPPRHQADPDQRLASLEAILPRLVAADRCAIL